MDDGTHSRWRWIATASPARSTWTGCFFLNGHQRVPKRRHALQGTAGLTVAENRRQRGKKNATGTTARPSSGGSFAEEQMLGGGEIQIVRVPDADTGRELAAIVRRILRRHRGLLGL